MGDADVRKRSKFCNEGKWENFIAPLLPEGDVFIEYGSNAGMYLKLAREKYGTVIGLERNANDCEVARTYLKDTDCQVIHRQIDEHIDDLPLADVTLLANFHYHQHIDEFRRLLDVLEHRTCYALIVSVREPQRHWRAQAGVEDVLGYFRHWELAKQIPFVPASGDPHPRPMFSM